MITGLVGTIGVCAVLFGVSVIRPQWGVLGLAALLPFHGLLLIAPVATDFWKEAAVLAIILACPFARRTGRDRTVVAPWLPPLILLVPLGVVSALVAFGTEALFPVKIAFFYVALALIVVWFPFDRTDKDRFITILFATGFVSALYGLWQQMVGPYALAEMGYVWDEQIRSAGPLLRSFGPFNQPFPFGLFLMLVIILGAAAALAEPRRLRSRLFLLACPVLAAGLVLSVVRASLLGLVVGLAVLGALLYRRLLVWMAAAAVVGIPGAVAVSEALGSPLLETLVSGSSLAERGDHWSVNIPQILVNPLGTGLGTTGSSAAKVWEGHDPAHPLYQPDSNYMKLLLEVGPIGLVLYGAVVALMVLTLTRMIPHLRDPLERGVAAGAAAATVAACAAAFFSTYLEIFPMDAYFWLVPAIAASTTRTVADRVSGRLPRARSGPARGQTTPSTMAAIRARNESSENPAANRASAEAG